VGLLIRTSEEADAARFNQLTHSWSHAESLCARVNNDNGPLGTREDLANQVDDVLCNLVAAVVVIAGERQGRDGRHGTLDCRATEVLEWWSGVWVWLHVC
jgi:hypothetical protein